RMPEEESEVQPSEDPPARPTRAHTLDLGLGGLDQPSVRHAGGAHGLARAAIEAERQMLDRRVAETHAALGESLDHEDAAARRIHLGPELGERRTVRETKPAMYALVHALDGEAVQREWSGGSGRGRRAGHRAQIPATNRPGLRRLRGSSWALIRCMIRP